MDSVLALFQPEYVFSVTFFLVIIGGGVWFGRSGWEWTANYYEKRLELKHQAEMERVRCEIDRDARWQNLVADLTQAFSELQHTLGRFEAMQQQFLNNQELFFRYLVKNGNKTKEDSDSGG